MTPALIAHDRNHRRPWFIAAIVYVVVTLVMIRPFIELDELATASFAGDGRLIVWTLAWPLHALMTGQSLFDANIFYPSEHALRYTEHMLTLGIVAAPFNLVTRNPVLACNLVWVLSFWTNAMAAHTLLVWLTRRHLPAFVAALIFGWGFFRMSHLTHLQLQWTAGLPLLLVALGRWYRVPTWNRMMLAFIIGAAQVLTSWYLAVMTVVLGTAWVAWLFACERWPGTRVRLVHLCVAALVGVVVVSPVALPYVRTIEPGPLSELNAGSADLASYVIPPRNTLAGSLLQDRLATRWIWGEQTLFLGWTAMLLASVGLVGSLIKDRDWARFRAPLYFAALGAFALCLSLGPSSDHFAPFDLLLATPGLSLFRAPGRFGLLVLLSVAVLAGFGVLLVFHRLRGSLPRVLFAAFAGVAILGECFVIGSDIPRAERLSVPPVYRAFDHLPPGAVVSLPDYRLRPEWFLRADYLLFAAHHWRPIVNGYGRAEPAEYLSTIEQLSEFPAGSSVELARALGVRYVVIDTDRWGSDERVVAAEKRQGIRLVARSGSAYLFEVE
ncbi:MAG: hypothetical protein LC791_02225 [Acidobacteria bacterium]|nr:hypothetical protein [Acidobacteriota bacterium]